VRYVTVYTLSDAVSVNYVGLYFTENSATVYISPSHQVSFNHPHLSPQGQHKKLHRSSVSQTASLWEILVLYVLLLSQDKVIYYKQGTKNSSLGRLQAISFRIISSGELCFAVDINLLWGI
jgi:hypothetical protein